jgi:predicted glycosyl hydrolase (DUF1957 family)
MIYLGFLLHIYQPPNQLDEVLEKIVEECYRPLLNMVNSRANASFTFNINWSLTEKLLQKGYLDLLESIRNALESGRIEITGTSAYHAILPLIPRTEQVRQILLNYEKNREVLGQAYRVRGFFPPEMAFGHELIGTLKDLGYKWTITDDIPFTCLHSEVPHDYIATADGLPVLLRSNHWSNKISMLRDEKGNNFSGKSIAEWLIEDMSRWFQGKDGYIILAMDGETFGHHIKGYIELFLSQFLKEIARHPDRIRMVHLSELLELFPQRETEVPPGSWSTSPEDFWEGNFFPLWKNKYNEAHNMLWELTDLALRAVNKLHERLDRSLNSCTFWWTAVKPEEASPITFSGIEMLMDVIRQSDPKALPKALEIRSNLERLMSYRANLQIAPEEQVAMDLQW